MVLILSKQILIMFTLIAIGYLFFKKNMITIQGSADMGKVLLYLVIPVVIVNSFWIESVERQIKCTKKFKLNANKNDVKFNSIQFI